MQFLYVTNIYGDKVLSVTILGMSGCEWESGTKMEVLNFFSSLHTSLIFPINIYYVYDKKYSN